MSKSHSKNFEALVTGTGVVSACGIGVGALVSAVAERRTALASLEAARGAVVGTIGQPMREVLRAEFRDHPYLSMLRALPEKYELFIIHDMLLAALSEALAQAGWDDGLRADDGFIFATTTGQIPLWEEDLQQYLAGKIGDDDLVRSFRHQPLALIMHQLIRVMCPDFRGPSTLVTTACAASTQAIGLAKLWIESGRVKRCLIGGTELLCQLTLRGFESFQLLSRNCARPFDQHRDGINLSEGAAFMCVERSEQTDVARGLASIRGFGTACDAFHMTAPRRDGAGCSRAMQMALADAQLSKSQIGWIHAHGTGSVPNDFAESSAIDAVFGRNTPVSSTKAIHGHSLGISGFVETALALGCFERKFIPGTVGMDSKDPNIFINIMSDEEKPWDGVRYFLKNSLAFGGVNASVVFEVKQIEGLRRK